MTARGRRLSSNTVTAPEEYDEPQGRRWWVIVVPVVALVLAASLLIPSSRRQWTLSIFRQPTPYTALSFSKAWALPTAVVTNEPITLSFVIINQEGQNITYHYIIRQDSAGLSTTLGRSANTVAAGHSWTVSTVIRPTCLVSPCRIQVSLPGHPETIDFLAAVKA